MMDLATRVTIPETVLFRDLDGEAVLLDTVSGRYFGLNEVGTRMWALLQFHGEIEAVCRDRKGLSRTSVTGIFIVIARSVSDKAIHTFFVARWIASLRPQ